MKCVFIDLWVGMHFETAEFNIVELIDSVLATIHKIIMIIKKMEVLSWPVGNVQIVDIRLKKKFHLRSVHPAKKNVSSWITPAIHRTAQHLVLMTESKRWRY
jgi:hypothetical protein